MTDPKLEVGEAAARAPRLEHADVLLIERELDELERRCADVNDPQPLMTRLWAGKAIQQLRAARAPREPLEPPDLFREGWSAGFQEALQPDRYPHRDRCLDAWEALAAARSALPPPPDRLDEIQRSPEFAAQEQAIYEAAALPRVPEPDLIVAAYEKAVDEWSAQCFCFTSAPEALRRNAHEAAREGFAAIRDILGPLARPILDAEYKAAEQQAKSAALPRVPEPDRLKRAFFAAYHAQWVDNSRWIFDPLMKPGDPEHCWRAWIRTDEGEQTVGAVRAARAGAEAPSQLIAGLRAFAADLARYQDTYADECALITQAADALEGK
jgi:hypothetical protein